MEKNCKITLTAVASLTITLIFHAGVHIYFTWNSGNNNPAVLPRLSTPPQIKDITTSTIEIEWKGDYDGDGPVCGFIVELKPSASTSWKSVGYVSFEEDEGHFEYTIDRLDAGSLYEISVIILHCSGREGERSPEISQSTKDYALPRLSTQPQVKNVTTSTIEIEWEGAYDGDGPVCGFIVELKPPSFTSWTSVGFVSFDEDKDDFEYTIERLDASALYGISVIILHCSDREGQRSPQISQSTKDYALPRLSTTPQVQNVTTSTIGIEWKGEYDGDGPVCGFILELKPPSFKSWTSVGFVSFDEDEDDFEYTIDRLDAGALYGISVIILHCSGREGERGPEISQSTEDHEPQTEPPVVSTSPAPPCPPNPPSDHHWIMMFLIVVPVLSVIVFVLLVIITWCCVYRRRGEPHTQALLGGTSSRHYEQI